MSLIRLRGYDVDFPYPVPYNLQKDYMDKVLTCLDEKRHAVLESPTGTGKTLCLFAPVTAWAKRKKLQNSYDVPHTTSDWNKEFISKNRGIEQQGLWGTKRKSKVWYTARTHSQIAQTVSEVRKCNIEGLHIGVMGARDQLCINEQVLEEKDSYVKTVKCKELVKAKKCKYYTKLTYEKDCRRFFASGEVLDIEDLVNVGKSCGICPYFLAKKASESADIILLPYNYIIDRESRESNSFYLQNDVIIFDEGHNVPSTCEESYEFSFTSLDIALGIKNMEDVMISLSQISHELSEEEEIDVATHISNSMMIMKMLKKLESALSELNATNELLPVSELYKFFSSAGIDMTESRKLIEGIALFKNDSLKLSLNGNILETFNLFEKMMDTMFGSSVMSFDQATIDKSFKCSVTVDSERRFVKKFSLYCFNPSFGIKSLLMLGSQSIIITSGTLSPLRTFISELGLPNPLTLENKHIAGKSQVPFVILGKGVNNVKMDGAFKNRKDPKYVVSLGMSLTNLIASVPDGVLLLFSSYSMMQYLKESWESDLGIWTRLNSLKRVFVEPRKKDEFINCMENYKRAIDSGNGAVLMGVLRGKISEGMDFKDQYCRGVFIIGVPFPPVQDPRVIGKQKYAESLTIYNSVSKVEEKLYTQPYLSVEAMKATNQAIGRVIRHGKDYGIIVLVDYRFTWPSLFQNISSWLRGDIPLESNFSSAKKLVTDFFRNIHLGKLGVDEIHCQPVDVNGCPIASNVTYEEYDHRKQPRLTGPWIGLTPLDTINASKTNYRSSQPGNDSQTQIEQKSLDRKKLIAECLKSRPTGYRRKIQREPALSKTPESLLDAIEDSINTAAQDHRECDSDNDQSSRDTNKRKHEKEEEEEAVDSENSCPKLSPSLFSSPESSQKSQPKRFSHLKVRPILPAVDDDGDVVPNVENKFDFAKKSLELKTELIKYYKTAKQSLSVDNDQRFKQTSSRYMKGEVALSDVIILMDEVFLRNGKKSLFSGFGLCVKTNDVPEWTAACKKRRIDTLKSPLSY